MPGYLLHEGAQVICSHGGQARPVTPFPRVKVMGQAIVTQPPGHQITGCPFATPGGPQPCLTANWTTAATRIRAGGEPVLLQDSQAITAPNGVPLQVLVLQNRVRGV
ncbi:MAG TPA: hypothetical protein ENI90_09475 [Methylothermaceae bacterium]|nr:hypothetical protein [Methylothermaceae bacterium]